MAVGTVILQDTPEYQLLEETFTDDATGAVVSVGHRMAWKAGTSPFNSDQQQQRLQTALATFENNYTNWATLSNAQKDAAARQAQRAVAALIRQVLQQLDSPGV